MAKVVVLGSYAPSLMLLRWPLLRELIQRGHEVVASCPADEGVAVAEQLDQIGVKWCPIQFHRNRVSVFGDLLLTLKLVRMLRQESPDILITYTIKPNVFGGLAAAMARVPNTAVMVTGLGRAFGGVGLLSTILRRLLRFACRRAKTVFVQNPDNLADLIEKKVLRDDRNVTMTAGSGVDVEVFQPAPLPTPFTTLMMARLLKSKGVAEYLEAASIIHARGLDIKMRLAGWPDHGKDAVPLEDIDKAVSSGAIEYLGHLNGNEAVQEALAAATVYVLPSWHEGTPKSTLEAMAMGRPIVTTNVCGCRETVRQGVNGVLVEPRDPQMLADSIEQMSRDRARLERMGQASREAAISTFDARVVASSMCDALGL